MQIENTKILKQTSLLTIVFVLPICALHGSTELASGIFCLILLRLLAFLFTCAFKLFGLVFSSTYYTASSSTTK